MSCLRTAFTTCSNGALLLAGLLAMIGGCAQVPSHVDLAGALNKHKLGHKAKHNGSVVKDQQRDHLFAAARALEKQGNVAEAIEGYQSIIARFPNDTRSLHRLAVCHDKGGDAEASAKLYLRALHHAPQDADLLCDYGYSRYVHGDVLQAESMLKQALQIDPQHSRAHGNMGLVLGRLGRDGEALSAFKRSGLSHKDASENLRLLKQQLAEAKQDKHGHDGNQVDVKSIVQASNEVPVVPAELSTRSVSASQHITDKLPTAELAAIPPAPPAAVDPSGAATKQLSETELLDVLTSSVKKDVQYVGDPIRKTIRR